MPVIFPPGSSPVGVTGEALSQYAQMRMRLADAKAAREQRFGEQMGGAVADVGRSVGAGMYEGAKAQTDATKELARERRAAKHDDALLEKQRQEDASREARAAARQDAMDARQKDAEDFRVLTQGVQHGTVDPNGVAEPFKKRMMDLGIVRQEYSQDQKDEIAQLSSALAGAETWNMRPDEKQILLAQGEERIHQIMSAPRMVINEPKPPSFSELLAKGQIEQDKQFPGVYWQHNPKTGMQEPLYANRGSKGGDGGAGDELKQQELERKQYADQMKFSAEMEKMNAEAKLRDQKHAMEMAKLEAGESGDTVSTRAYEKHYANTPSGQKEAAERLKKGQADPLAILDLQKKLEENPSDVLTKHELEVQKLGGRPNKVFDDAPPLEKGMKPEEGKLYRTTDKKTGDILWIKSQEGQLIVVRRTPAPVLP